MTSPALTKQEQSLPGLSFRKTREHKTHLDCMIDRNVLISCEFDAGYGLF